MTEDDQTPSRAPDDHIVRARVTGPDAETLRSFIDESGADPSCRAVAVRTERGLSAQLLLTQSQLAAARGKRSAADVDIEELEDVTASQQAARADLGTGNRYATRGAVPRGLGRKE
jgi:hypothetical protein